MRAARLDEGLEVIAALWSGRPVTHSGEHYTVAGGVTLAPLPLQRPRVPIWVGGHSRAAQRRAARWDGWIINGDNETGEMVLPPDRLAADLAYIGRADPFDVAMTGASAGPDDPVLARYEAAGVTWWLEHIHERRGSQAELRARIEAGPPASVPT